MAPYVDGYVLPIRKDKVEEYKKMAELGGKIWTKHGALAYFECLGDDLNPNMGEHVEGDNMQITTFPSVMKTSSEETVIFAFVIYSSRAHRDEVNAKVMSDPEMDPSQYEGKEMPMDPSRMAYGGFEAIVHLQK